MDSHNMRPSVNNLNLTRGRKLRDHRADECELVCAIVNIPQLDVVPDLKIAGKLAVEATLADLELQALLATSPCAAAHHRAMFSSYSSTLSTNELVVKRCSAAHKADVKPTDDLVPHWNGRPGYRVAFMKTLATQGAACAISRATLVPELGPFSPSVRRIDTRRDVVSDNVKWVARLFCGRYAPSRAEWLMLVVQQGIVPLTDRQRELLEFELSAIRMDRV
jgi:hypothetical protein